MAPANASVLRILLASFLAFLAGLLALVAVGAFVSAIPALSHSTLILWLLPLAFLVAAGVTASVVLDVGKRSERAEVPRRTRNMDVVRAVCGDKYVPLTEAGVERSPTAAREDPPMFRAAVEGLLQPKAPRIHVATIFFASAAIFLLLKLMALCSVLFCLGLFSSSTRLAIWRRCGSSDTAI